MAPRPQPDLRAAEHTIAGMSVSDRRAKRQRVSADPVARYLGDLQAQVMAILWRRESATVREVVDELNEGRKRELAYTTVLTLVSRLWSRRLLTRDPEGRGYRYRPAKTRDELLGDFSDELIDRLLSDFGEIAVARLSAKLDALVPSRERKLREARKRP